MQKSLQIENINYIVSRVWQIIGRMRRIGSPISEALTTALLYLYCFHKGYGIYKFKAENICGHIDDDFILEILETGTLDPEDYLSFKDENLHNELVDFMEILGDDGYEDDDYNAQEEFNTVYVEVLKRLFELACRNSSRQEGEFLTPYAITRLMAYFVKKEGCKSVYDPFCGTASIVHDIAKENIKFVGQELDERIWMFAGVNHEAAYGEEEFIPIKHGDSICNWNSAPFDAVVSCPPFALRMSKEQIESLHNSDIQFECRTLDDVLLTRAFSINGASLTITLHPMGFCYNGLHYYELRKYLVERNLLDMVIALPSNILYGTSIPSVLIVCKQNRDTSAPITFVNAENYVLGRQREKAFDVERFIAMIEGDKRDCISVNTETVCSFDYNLVPDLYSQQNLELHEGQRLVRLGDIIKPAIMDKIESTVSESISLNKLSSDFITVLRNKNQLCEPLKRESSMASRIIHPNGKNYLLTFSVLGDNKYGLYTKEEDVVCSSSIKAFQIDDSIVTPTYLIYRLTNHKIISKGAMPLSAYLNLSIVIDKLERQDFIVDTLVQQYVEQAKTEQEADAKRLGVKQNISDLEHMLSPIKMRIDHIIAKLEKTSSDGADASSMIKALKDNVEYMYRIIHFGNAKIDSDSFNMKICDLGKFIESYAEGWKNYGGPYFELSICNEVGSVEVSCDTKMLTVMCDAILSNAVRHGFRKNKNHTPHNQVQIGLFLVEYKETPYLCLSFANNGNPMDEGFTIGDYISRGRYSATTGRSGLGGYHIYSIAKCHKGFLSLESNKIWNMVVEVLLPISSAPTKNVSIYEHECI